MRLVVVGHGMVGSRLVEELVRRGADVDVTVLGAEPHEPYNRVLLGELVAGRVDEDSLALPAAGDGRVLVRRGVVAVRIDRGARTVTCDDGGVVPYDALVLATGAHARVPELPGLHPSPLGVHPLRTLADARHVAAAVTASARAVVLGGGVLGLEVACALTERGTDVAVVHAGPHLMDRQLDAAASGALEHGLRRLGVSVRVGRPPAAVLVRGGRVRGLRLSDGDELPADLLVLATGTVPDVALAADSGLAVGRGVVVDGDGATSDPHVYAIGDCAQPSEGSSGLVAQGWEQARRLAEVLAAPRPAGVPRRSRTVDADALTDVVRLKAHGLEVVSMGVTGAAAAAAEHRAVRLSDPSTGRHVEVVVAGGVVVGATCVGAGPVAADLTAAYTRRTPVPADPAHLLLRPVRGSGPEPEPSVTLMPDRATVCRCNGVTKGELVRAWADGARTPADVARATRATTGCGGCTDAVCGLLDWLADAEGDRVLAGASALAQATG